MSKEMREQIDNFKDWNESNNTHLIPVRNVNRYLYHTSNPYYRDKISKEGLIPKEKSERWLSNTKIKGKVIFAINSDNPDDIWDNTYDDDVYKIDTNSLDNNWFNDPNFDTDNKHIITFDAIPNSAIKLIYEGTGEWES